MAAAPAPAPSASPIPLDTGDYATAAATANAAYQSALSSINGQRQQALQSFGYQGQIDPTTGQLTNMQVDPHNPYGQYQQMLSQGATDQAGVRAGAMSRGLGAVTGARGGGLAAQDLANAKLAFGGQSAALGENLMSTLGNLSSQQQDAQTTENNALWNAELASAQNAIQQQQFNPADFSGITDQPVKGGTVPAPKTLTTNADSGTVKNPGKPAPGTGAGRGVKFRPHGNRGNHGGHNDRGGNTFHKAVRTRHSRRGGGGGGRNLTA
jgi:hypothetical protein